jgi:hypothetical protein
MQLFSSFLSCGYYHLGSFYMVDARQQCPITAIAVYGFTKLWNPSSYFPLSYVEKPANFRKSSAKFSDAITSRRPTSNLSELCIVLDGIIVTDLV